MTTKVTAFDEQFPGQAEGARKLERYYAKNEENMTSQEKRDFAAKVENLGNSVLGEDICWRLESNKVVHFTEENKQRVLKNYAELIQRGHMRKVQVGGYCLNCGKSYHKNDIRLAETDGSGNSICLACCTKNNKTGRNNNTELQFCTV